MNLQGAGDDTVQPVMSYHKAGFARILFSTQNGPITFITVVTSCSFRNSWLSYNGVAFLVVEQTREGELSRLVLESTLRNEG